jgi:hypothetical protein
MYVITKSRLVCLSVYPSHHVSSKWRIAEKSGKERSCSLGRDSTGNIVNFALTHMSWTPDKCIVTCYLRSQPIRDSLLGNSLQIRNSTVAVARQRPASNNGSTVGSGVLYVVRPEAISLHRQSSKQFSEFQIRRLE